MTYKYLTSGTCSRSIIVDIEGDTVKDVAFEGGCHGNTQGITALVRGLKVEDVVSRLDGLKCKNKDTSCPDQLAKAIRAAIAGYQQGNK